jgi:hypothetical protein
LMVVNGDKGSDDVFETIIKNLGELIWLL